MLYPKFAVSLSENLPKTTRFAGKYNQHKLQAATFLSEVIFYTFEVLCKRVSSQCTHNNDPCFCHFVDNLHRFFKYFPVKFTAKLNILQKICCEISQSA